MATQETEFELTAVDSPEDNLVTQSDADEGARSTEALLSNRNAVPVKKRRRYPQNQRPFCRSVPLDNAKLSSL